MQAAQTAKAFGIKIHTIGVGTRGKAPFLVNSIFGQRYVYQEVDIDEGTLQEIAKITGGQYFRATDLESLESLCIIKMCEAEILSIFFKHQSYIIYKINY